MLLFLDAFTLALRDKLRERPALTGSRCEPITSEYYYMKANTMLSQGTRQSPEQTLIIKSGEDELGQKNLACCGSVFNGRREICGRAEAKKLNH